MRHRTLTPHEFSGGVIVTGLGSISTRSYSSSLSSSFWPPHACESSEACDGNLRNHAGMKNAPPFACFFPFVWFVRSWAELSWGKGGDDSGCGRLTGSVSFRQEKKKKHTQYLCLSRFFLEKGKFRRRKPKRFHVSPPSFRSFFRLSLVFSNFKTFMVERRRWRRKCGVDRVVSIWLLIEWRHYLILTGQEEVSTCFYTFWRVVSATSVKGSIGAGAGVVGDVCWVIWASRFLLFNIRRWLTPWQPSKASAGISARPLLPPLILNLH